MAPGLLGSGAGACAHAWGSLGGDFGGWPGAAGGGGGGGSVAKEAKGQKGQERHGQCCCRGAVHERVHACTHVSGDAVCVYLLSHFNVTCF